MLAGNALPRQPLEGVNVDGRLAEDGAKALLATGAIGGCRNGGCRAGWRAVNAEGLALDATTRGVAGLLGVGGSGIHDRDRPIAELHAG